MKSTVVACFLAVNSARAFVQAPLKSLSRLQPSTRVYAAPPGGSVEEMLKSLQSSISAMEARLQTELQSSISAMEARLQTELRGIKTELGVVTSELTEVKEESKAHSKQLASLSLQFGCFAESVARNLACELFGRRYARQLLVRSVQDCYHSLPSGSELLSCPGGPAFEDDGLTDRIKAAASFACRRLVDEDIPERLLRVVVHKWSSRELKFKGLDLTKLFEGESVDYVTTIGRLIKACPDKAMIPPLNRMRRVLALATPEERTQELQRCESAGVMCMLAAGHPNFYLNNNANVNYTFPPEILEFDMRGAVSGAEKGQFGSIDIAEIKASSSGQLGKAVDQLGLRLGALRWLFFQAASGRKRKGKAEKAAEGLSGEVRLVGRIFVGKETDDSSNVTDEGLRNTAFDKWGFSLYTHRF